MIHSRIVLGALALCTLFAGISGCGSGEPRRYAVSGEVKWRNKPLDHGAILFMSDDPKVGSSGGAQIKEGKYTIPAAQGLLPGRYKVSINSADPSKAPDPEAQPGVEGPVTKDRINPKYNEETTLTAEVKAGGANTFNFSVD